MSAISKLLEIAPATTLDSAAKLYNTAMYALAALLRQVRNPHLLEETQPLQASAN